MSDTLPVDERRLKAATKRAIKAAGALKVCEAETGRSDSMLSRYCSPNLRDSISIRDAVRIDAIGGREEGYPHILTTMADLLGAVVIMLPEPVTDDLCLQMGVLALSTEVGDVSRSVSDAIAGTSAGGASVTSNEARAVLEHVAHLERAAARLRHQLERIAEGEPAPTT